MNKVLILSSVWVEPNSSAAGSRMLQLIHFFITQKYEITYASTAGVSDFSLDLETLGITYTSIKINDTNFDLFLQKTNPSIVLFDRFIIEEQFGWRVSEICPNAIKILDTEDLHCLRKAREIAYKNKTAYKEKDILKLDSTKREIASILRCDLSLIISKYEMELLKNQFKIEESILLYLPFMLDAILEKEQNNSINFTNRKHFYFIGNFRHKPNIESVLYLKKTIWKEIAKKLPNAELHIFGAYPTQQILQLHNTKERFLVKGRLKDISELKKYRILLAPILFGAGLKGKFIEAMQNFTPSITTKTGQEGIGNTKNWSGKISASEKEIIANAIELYTNRVAWETAQKNGIEILNTNFNKDFFQKKLHEKINYLTIYLEKHRDTNFIGQLLQHHTLQSTKYLSKWIEEKNAK